MVCAFANEEVFTVACVAGDTGDADVSADILTPLPLGHNGLCIAAGVPKSARTCGAIFKTSICT